MRLVIFGLLTLASAAAAQTAPPQPETAAVPPVIAVPAAPIDAARLAAARSAAAAILPPGGYGKMMQDMMGSTMTDMMGSMLDMSPADFGAALCPEKAKKCDTDTAKTSMREQIKKEDPYFEERMRIMGRVMGEEFGRIGAIIEPGMREGLAKSMAKRFSVQQLADINGFFSTDTGHTFAGQMLTMWVDPEVMKSVMGSMPEIMKAMPDIIKKVEAATAHLPKPKTKAKAKGDPTS